VNPAISIETPPKTRRPQAARLNHGKANTNKTTAPTPLKTAATPTHANTTTLTALSWNVRGLTWVAPEMDAIIQEYSPDFMVMSETKLTDRLHGKSYVKECAPG
jgi:hypothetical protein